MYNYLATNVDMTISVNSADFHRHLDRIKAMSSILSEVILIRLNSVLSTDRALFLCNDLAARVNEENKIQITKSINRE